MLRRIIAIILFTVFPFGQLLRFELGNGIVLHINDILVGIIGFCGLVRIPMVNSSLKKVLIIWVGIAWLSLFLNFNFWGVLYLVRWIVYAGLYFFFYDFIDADFLRQGLQRAILLVALVGLGQYMLMPDTRFLAASHWDDHSFRVIFTFLDPGFTGIILVLGLLSQFWEGKWLGIIYTVMILTYSRATYLAYLAGVVFIALSRRALRVLGLALVIFVFSITLLPRSYGESTNLRRENSLVARLKNWQQAISIWQNSPLLGVGFGNYQYYSGASFFSHSKSGSDSSILTVLATTGILGLLAYLWLLMKMWQAGNKNLLFKAGFVAVLIHSWFNNTLFYPWVMEWLWITLALTGNDSSRV